MNIDIDKIIATLEALSEGDMNDICDQRDMEVFENGWNDIYDRLECERLDYHPGQMDNFVRISNCTHQHEITGYISDDLDLIHCAQLKGITSPFLESMIKCYESGEIPK